MVASSLVLGALAGLTAAQFPPKPEAVNVLKSKFHENVTISYKEVSFRHQTSVCGSIVTPY